MSRENYRADLAAIHHEGFGELVRRAAPVLLAAFARAGLAGGRVVDLGCGSGVFLRELGRAGYEAVGVDPSSAMIALSRKVAPRARLHRVSAHRFRVPACVAVTALGETLQYIPHAEAAAPSLPALFRRVAGALAPGGLFVFDLLCAGRGPRLSYRTFRQGRSWVVLIAVEEDRRRRRLHRRIITFRQTGRTYRRDEEIHVLQIPEPSTVTRALRAAGFKVRVLRHLGQSRLLPHRRLFWSRLPR